MSHPLDNAAWHALNTVHADLEAVPLSQADAPAMLELIEG